MANPTLEDFVKDWWSRNSELADTELGSNGQFDELPYAAYAELYDKEIK